jgi:transposase
MIASASSAGASFFIKEVFMQVMHGRCCGLDVHKDSVVGCIRIVHPDGRIEEAIESFATTTRGILELGDWLLGHQVSIAVMESTGVYWKPIWNLLEDVLDLMLVNARHIKQVPGRKTDVKDCQWIAQLLGCGLLSRSFVPPRPQRQLRDLTRQRAQLMQDTSRVASRIQKVLEDANIKLASVASDALGKSGRAMIRALIEGQLQPAAMAQLARGKLKEKIPQLTEALQGRVNDHHRFMLRQLLEQLEQIEKQVEAFDARLEEVMSPLEQQMIRRLDEIPGLDQRSAQVVIAEIGCDMSRFATSGHLASWAGLCPGNNQSAGKRRGGRMTEGNRWLKRTLSNCAWAASRCKNSYFRSQHRRIASRRGAKRATMAVAHSQLCLAYELIKNNTPYHDLGVNYFQQIGAERLKENLVHRLEKLGYRVNLESKAA